MVKNFLLRPRLTPPARALVSTAICGLCEGEREYDSSVTRVFPDALPYYKKQLLSGLKIGALGLYIYIHYCSALNILI